MHPAAGDWHLVVAADGSDFIIWPLLPHQEGQAVLNSHVIYYGFTIRYGLAHRLHWLRSTGTGYSLTLW